jgi:hypothetical protein
MDKYRDRWIDRQMTDRQTDNPTVQPFVDPVGSLCHAWFTTTNLSYRFPIFETSATALCGTWQFIMQQLSYDLKNLAWNIFLKTI